MKEIVINSCYGGFSLSDQAIMRYAEIKGIKLYKGKKDFSYTPYYLVPEEEFEKIHKEDKKKGDYNKSNDLCFSSRDFERDDPILVQVVKELKEKANGSCAELKVVEIPDNVKWFIDEYDGIESIHEKHDSWS